MALRLTRYVGESIDIGTNISVTILDVRGNRVGLAIAAPKEVLINRREVTEAIAREKAARDESEAK